jgi:hypothetical protein
VLLAKQTNAGTRNPSTRRLAVAAAFYGLAEQHDLIGRPGARRAPRNPSCHV